MWLLYWWYSKWYICCGYHYLCDCNMCLAHFIARCTTMYFSTHINRALWDVMSGISRLFNGMGQWTWNLCHVPALVTLPHIAEIFCSYITLLCGYSTVRITRRGSGPCRSNARSATMISRPCIATIALRKLVSCVTHRQFCAKVDRETNRKTTYCC